MTREWKAGDRSWQVKGGYRDAEGKYQNFEAEFASEAEAMASVETVLLLGTMEEVAVVKWSHQHNMPGCLPAVRAYSLSLTTYRLVDGELAEKPINIHEGY